MTQINEFGIAYLAGSGYDVSKVKVDQRDSLISSEYFLYCQSLMDDNIFYEKLFSGSVPVT